MKTKFFANVNDKIWSSADSNFLIFHSMHLKYFHFFEATGTRHPADIQKFYKTATKEYVLLWSKKAEKIG